MCGSSRFRHSKVWELPLEALNPCFQVQSFRTFSEIGRELHRRSTFKQKLYGKSAIEQRLGKLLLHTLIARHVKTEAPRVFQGHFFKLEAPHVCFGKCSFYGVFLKKHIALSWELHEKCSKQRVLIIYRKIRWFWKVDEKSIYFWRQIGSSEVR